MEEEKAVGHNHRRDIIKTRNPTRLPAHVAWAGIEVLARRV